MTFYMLDLKEINNIIDGIINGSIDVDKGRSKQDAVIIMCRSHVLYLQSFLRERQFSLLLNMKLVEQVWR